MSLARAVEHLRGRKGLVLLCPSGLNPHLELLSIAWQLWELVHLLHFVATLGFLLHSGLHYGWLQNLLRRGHALLRLLLVACLRLVIKALAVLVQTARVQTTTKRVERRDQVRLTASILRGQTN